MTTRHRALIVTISTRNKQAIFGRIQNDEIMLNEWGNIADHCWKQIREHFPQVDLDAFIVMPSHIHGILLINEADKSPVEAQHAPSESVGATHASPLRQTPHGPAKGSLGAIIGSYKASVTRSINRLSGAIKEVWHRNYYERVLRNERELQETRHYITYNAYKESK